ncbi:unnamed protein product [Agarophyton chilense]|eukprot:gb/GEZJ01000939.1/.p1 GENE.gb/GEZJ01000939.1/~~gb/GEZJ01000939.1/.p1  ORF type:complete len:833 (-),score=118.93 gb/GEZJ01000939.1/:3984-6482(-)
MTTRPSHRRRVVVDTDPESLIKILISTDNHLGYLEKDPVRGDDSFRVFEEVLELAKTNQVDMVLLGGDLFHDNKPSRSTIVKTMKILRHACLSPEGQVRIAVRSDHSQVNYMDPSVAVSLPVFVIHGNHDDPTGGTGLEALSAIDLLSQAGLVTYFGKMSTSKKIDIFPILLQKGQTRLALYGLGNIRDEVLYDTWARQRNVKWHSPDEPGGREQSQSENESDDQDPLRWFNLFVLHQNRLTRGSSRGISETLLPPWLDYVVWGHEHDSLPELTLSEPPVVQPGSTVATSLSQGESKPKHCVLLEIYKGKLKHRPVPLYTVRNFEFEDIALSQQENLSETDPEGVKHFLSSKITELVERQEAAFDVKRSSFQTGTSFESVNGIKYPPRAWYIKRLTDNVRRPLVRLRVEITGNWDPPNPQRFGQDFVGKAASPNEILLFYRHKRRPLKRSQTFLQGRQGADVELAFEDGEDNEGLGLSQDGNTTSNVMQIPRLVQYYLYHHRAGGTGLKFLELDTLTNAVDQFVNKSESKAIVDYVASYLKVQQDKTLEEALNADKSINEEEMLKKFQAAAAAAANRALISGDNTEEQKISEETATNRKGKPNLTQAKSSGDTQSLRSKQKAANQGETGIGDAPQASEGDLVQNSQVGKAAFDASLDEVHAMVTSVPRLAKASAERRKLEDMDNSEVDGISAIEPRSRSTRGRGQGQRRGRARGRATERQSGRGAAPSSRPRRTGRKNMSLAESSDNEDEIIPENARESVYDEEEEYIPTPSTRKRRATNNASGSNARASGRARTESLASSGSRRTPFASRMRVRRSAAVIDLDEESGDDAM